MKIDKFNGTIDSIQQQKDGGLLLSVERTVSRSRGRRVSFGAIMLDDGGNTSNNDVTQRYATTMVDDTMKELFNSNDDSESINNVRA